MNRSDEIGMIGTGMKGERRSIRAHPGRSFAIGWGVKYRLRLLGLESAAKRRYKMVSTLIACVAAIIVISAIASVPMGEAKASVPMDDEVSDGVIINVDPPPYYVAGYTYDAVGAKLPSVLVNITNTRTGSWNLTISNETTSMYRFNLHKQTGGFLLGDVINVTATKDLWIGWNETAIPTPQGSYLSMHVTLGTEIPEFPMAILPVMGSLVLVVTVGAMRRGRER